MCLPVCGILDLNKFFYFQPGSNPRMGFLEFFKRVLQDFLMPHLHVIPIDAKTSPLILMAPTGFYIRGHQIFHLTDFASVRCLVAG
jgi:hypothetical protein